VHEAPTGGGFSDTPQGPFDRVFVNVGVYRVRLRIRDNLTGCESADEVQVRVFEKPQPAFTINRVCAQSPTVIADASTLDAIAGEQIISWEWDVDFDGTTFNPEPTLTNQRNVQYTYSSAGSYEVALRVTTDGGACSSIVQHTAIVDPLPVATFTPDVTAGCSTLPVRITNHAAAGQPDVIREFVWEVDDGSGFKTDSIQKPTDTAFSDVFVRNFVNTGTINRDYQIRLRVVTINGCEITRPSPSTRNRDRDLCP
jgi:hypothetical protein